jgi:hypothetical protein
MVGNKFRQFGREKKMKIRQRADITHNVTLMELKSLLANKTSANPPDAIAIVK